MALLPSSELKSNHDNKNINSNFSKYAWKIEKPKGPFQNTNTNTVHTVFPGARTTVPWGGRLSTGAILFPSRGVHCPGCPVFSHYVFQDHFSRGSYPVLGKPDSVQRPLRARLPLSVFLGSPPSKGSTPFTSSVSTPLLSSSSHPLLSPLISYTSIPRGGTHK